ncbi:AAA family ATPase [Streptomyces sp. SID13031]|uniref:AAA family ATPase n=1 Tax=Streptomyces sp. SID13031 TaxID=2706046 RepID=UPI0013C7AD8E|nr:AAA family ATPase [Streptomyces sp. SID13031]NEA35915.1 AAA family ATPase [Streptomyces sp. SID13031]
MRLAVSGTYSTGKTITTMALAHYTGITRSAAKTMRELLPISVPGKTLEQCTGSEILMLITRRNTERAVNESHLGDSFISDGSSIHEWIYGTVRVIVGVNPTANTTMENVERTDEIRYFEDVIEKLGVPAKQHAKANYDAFVRLPIEFPMVADGHRPVNERFRLLADEMIQAEVDKLGIPTFTAGGTVEERLVSITGHYGLPTALSVDEAVARAKEEYALIDTRSELERV